LEPITETKKHKLDSYREDEESQLTERLRNLSITSSNVERVGKRPEKLKSYHDDQAEHLRGGGYQRGVSKQRNGAHCMHKGHRRYIYMVQRREGLLLLRESSLPLWRRISGVYKDTEHRSRKWTVDECCIERIWHREHKMEKNRKCKGCAEDTDVDRVEQCNRTTTRLVSH
jgi:hypothetical protein